MESPVINEPAYLEFYCLASALSHATMTQLKCLLCLNDAYALRGEATPAFLQLCLYNNKSAATGCRGRQWKDSFNITKACAKNIVPQKNINKRGEILCSLLVKLTVYKAAFVFLFLYEVPQVRGQPCIINVSLFQTCPTTAVL